LSPPHEAHAAATSSTLRRWLLRTEGCDLAADATLVTDFACTGAGVAAAANETPSKRSQGIQRVRDRHRRAACASAAPRMRGLELALLIRLAFLQYNSLTEPAKQGFTQPGSGRGHLQWGGGLGAHTPWTMPQRPRSWPRHAP